MSSKEARRPGLVQAAIAGKLTNAEAAHALRLSVRQFRRLRAAYQRSGVEGLLHGNRGRPPSNRWTDRERQRIVEMIEGKYAGFNDCHLTEKLRELEQIDICREMVRRLRHGAGIAPVRRRRAPKHRRRRLREAHEGALVLIDASEHHWLGADQPRFNLLGAVDDATGRIVALHFRPGEDLHGYTVLLAQLIARHGLPCNLYGDRLGVFVRNDDHWSLEEQLAGAQRPTQFGRMLVELAIGFITAHSPQAKGRIERLWETLQDRLVQELCLRGIATVAAAEAYLPEFITDYNHRFAVSARESRSAWRSRPRDLERILACRYTRTVAHDNTVTIPGRWIQLPPGPRGRSWHRCQVEVRELLDGRMMVCHQHRILAEQPWDQSAFTLIPRNRTPPMQRARHGVDLQGSPRSPDRRPARPKTQPSDLERLTAARARKAKPDNPWRKRFLPEPGPETAPARGT